MDTDLVRFRIDAALREKAARVCADLGLELHDVLRTVISRIARDGTLPFEADATAPHAPGTPRPFADYDQRLWSGLKPQIDAEVALTLLVRYIAERSAQLAAVSPAGDSEQIARLAQERGDALALRRSLDLSDPEAVARVIARYTPLVGPGTKDA
ncbi:MAG: type II toxin-antitoxin system RelB/DinJ family antitoxin [Proteobacteria bacterium]|nr:type II toxin-antitoxin system RelB/DinJ family antitoxin [Pseudomonadota bacterium]